MGDYYANIVLPPLENGSTRKVRICFKSTMYANSFVLDPFQNGRCAGKLKGSYKIFLV